MCDLCVHMVISSDLDGANLEENRCYKVPSQVQLHEAASNYLFPSHLARGHISATVVQGSPELKSQDNSDPKPHPTIGRQSR